MDMKSIFLSFLKKCTLLTWLFTTLSAAYIGAIFTDIIAPPKDVLCKLSIGFCPSPEVIVFSAGDIDHIQDKDGVGQAPGIDQIGMVHNNISHNVHRPNMIKYMVNVLNNGMYKMSIYYASAEARPLSIYVNELSVKNNALAEKTGGWNNMDREWSPMFEIPLLQGNNTITLKSAHPFPHISKLKFEQILQ